MALKHPFFSLYLSSIAAAVVATGIFLVASNARSVDYVSFEYPEARNALVQESLPQHPTLYYDPRNDPFAEVLELCRSASPFASSDYCIKVGTLQSRYENALVDVGRASRGRLLAITGSILTSIGVSIGAAGCVYKKMVNQNPL